MAMTTTNALKLFSVAELLSMGERQLAQQRYTCAAERHSRIADLVEVAKMPRKKR